MKKNTLAAATSVAKGSAPFTVNGALRFAPFEASVYPGWRILQFGKSLPASSTLRHSYMTRITAAIMAFL